MKRTSARPRALGIATLFLLIPFYLLRADVFYSGLQNIAAPTTFEGVYLNLENGVSSAGGEWDINVVFGGARLYNSDSFQPARVGTDNEDPVIALLAGATVGGNLIYSTGFGASDGHLGSGANQFQPGQEAYLGFHFTTDANSGPHYGWMRVVFTANEPGGVIKDWGYETGVAGSAPKSITTGNILQAAPSGGVSVVTLTAATGEASTLGSILSNGSSGDVTAVSKTGAGTWTLSGNQTYTGATTLNADGGTLEVGASGGKLSGTTSINIHSGGTLLLSGTGGTNIKLNSAAPVTLAGGEIDLGGMTSSLEQSVGALTLSASSTLDFATLLAGHTWHFGASNADWSGLQLTVLNYTSGADHLFFGSDTTGLNTAQLSRIVFYSDNGSDYLGMADWTGGMGEITPVPEAGTWAAGLLTAGAVAYMQQRRRSRVRPSQEEARTSALACGSADLNFRAGTSADRLSDPRRTIC